MLQFEYPLWTWVYLLLKRRRDGSSSTVGRLEGQTLLGSGLQAPALSLKGGWEEGITQRECHNLLYNKLHKQWDEQELLSKHPSLLKWLISYVLLSSVLTCITQCTNTHRASVFYSVKLGLTNGNNENMSIWLSTVNWDWPSPSKDSYFSWFRTSAKNKFQPESFMAVPLPQNIKLLMKNWLLRKTLTCFY